MRRFCVTTRARHCEPSALCWARQSSECFDFWIASSQKALLATTWHEQLRFCMQIVMLILAVFVSSFVHAEPELNAVNFLNLSDIHFDPFTGCAKSIPCPMIESLRQAPVKQWQEILAKNDTIMSKYRQDTRYPLLQSALNAAKLTADKDHAKFVLVLGDFLGHEYKDYYKKYSTDKSAAGYVAFVRKTLQFLTAQLAQTFPNLDIYMVVGNNDSYESDYDTNPNGPFFKDTAQLWSKLIKTKTNVAAMRQGFKIAGYYAVNLPQQPNLRLIVLNTNLFSYKGEGRNINKAANDELAWLQQQLMQVRKDGKKAIIAMHIPDGIDVFASMRMRLFTLVQLWREEYAQRFQEDLKQYAPEINAVFAGHLHSDWFHILTFDDKEIPVAGTPSISPIFGNDPGFKIFSYSPQSLQLINDVTYTYQLNEDKSSLTKWCTIRKTDNAKRCIAAGA